MFPLLPEQGLDNVGKRHSNCDQRFLQKKIDWSAVLATLEL